MQNRQWRDRAARIGDYLFGRNTLIGVASLMLLTISGYATWSGMSDFIVGVSSGQSGRELVGGLSVTNEALVIAIVITLTFLMWLSLRETFGPERFFFRERLVTGALYVFLALWSVGFGYGFWWSLIAGEEATRTSLSHLQEDARDASAVLAARLDAVKLQLDSVVSWSESQMAREEASGGSCGVRSGAGRGPLYSARLSVRDSVTSLRDNIAQSWVAPMQGDIQGLRAAASRLKGDSVEERRALFEELAASVRGKARSIAARSNSIGQSTAAEMRALATAVAVQPGQAGFSCHDPTLAQRLTQAAEQAAKPAVLTLREAEFNEGPAGVANAVKDMWASIARAVSFGFGGVRGLFGYEEPINPDAGRDATGTGDSVGFSGRDLIALLATLGIDLGLFALTVINPPISTPDRNTLTAAEIARAQKAIATAMSSAGGDEQVTLEWVRRHIINHIGTSNTVLSRGLHDSVSARNTASFLVIPNLSSVPMHRYDKVGSSRADRDAGGTAETGSGALNTAEERRALALNQVAGVLTDQGLVRSLSNRELNTAKDETGREARTRRHRDKADGAGEPSAKGPTNKGLFAKAHRTLEMAGWSAEASDDPEIFRLVEADGLLPLLKILEGQSDGDSSKGDREQPKPLASSVPRVQPPGNTNA